MDYAEKIKLFVEASKIPLESISESDVRGELKEFGAKIELIAAAKAFFEENSELEGGKTAFKNLVGFVEFKRLLI